MKNPPIRTTPPSGAVNAIPNKRRVCAVALLGASAVIATPAFASQTTMQLIEIMHDNGTISQQQYEQLRTAAAEDDKQTAVARRENKETAEKVDAKLAKFDWASRIKLKGDIRLRYEHDDLSTRENTAGNNINRDRGRLRYRLGVITQPLDNVEVGAGLASGGNDPRSTNQTFGNTFSSKGINLDYAYAQYSYKEMVKVIAGKFKFDDYLYQPTDLTWDGDINPEGASAHANLDNPLGTTFVNSGIWVIDEVGNQSSDPYLAYGQLGQAFEAGKVFGKLAGVYYDYQNTGQPNAFAFTAGTNTDNQFGVFDASGELGTKFDGGKIALVGQYVNNTQTNTDEDQGFAFGFKGAADLWSFKYIYADLDANAVPDSFPDSDRFGGATDMKGHEIALAYALYENLELGVDYYNTQRKSIDADDQLVQADMVLKF